MNQSVVCRKCGEALHGKPKIRTLANTYCFQCAKSAVAEEENLRYEQARILHELEKDRFKKRHAASVQFHSTWWFKRSEYITKNRLTFGTKTGIVIVVSFLGEQFQPGHNIGFIIFIMAAIITHLITKANDEKRIKLFEQKYPSPPPFDEKDPQFKAKESVSFELLPPDESSLIPKNRLRDEIIRRDKLTCQCCGARKQKKNLEVHHIIPSSSGGIDHPTNLITLCIYCHDREDWFGHKRKYPTTIRPLRRRGYYSL